MHFYNFGTPLSIVAPALNGKSEFFTPMGGKQNGFVNPKTEPKTPKAPELGRKQSICIGH